MYAAPKPQHELFSNNQAPRIARLICEYCDANDQQRGQVVNEIDTMLTAHPMAVTRFLRICNPLLPGLESTQVLVDHVRERLHAVPGP